MAKSQKKWALASPVFTPGQQVYAYQDNTPGKIIGRDGHYLGYWLVRIDDDAKEMAGRTASIAWDNLATTPE